MMKVGFYPKLAWIGIKKNTQIYFPYILTCIGMVMMYYIVSFLRYSQNLSKLAGGDTVRSMMSTGTGVIAVFAAVFLFYTNSFLAKRRKKELGLYNILGMGKKNLVWIQIYETVFVAVFSVGGGLFCGVLFSKLAELLLTNIMLAKVNFEFAISQDSLRDTLLLFLLVFGIIFLRSVTQIGISNPIELLHSEQKGERRPRANWVLALVSVGILGVSYYLAASMEDPIKALNVFFLDVILVVLGTYLLFIAGFMALCRLLQKNKKYYYKTKHFFSVSSMTYRMRRNGAGLASICILATMVLVMISSTACLHIGREDILKIRYPRDFVMHVKTGAENREEIGRFCDTVGTILEKNRQKAEDILQYEMMEALSVYSAGRLSVDIDAGEFYQTSSVSKNCMLFIVPLSDYNRITGSSETLAKGEAILYSSDDSIGSDVLDIDVYGELKIRKADKSSQFIKSGDAVLTIFPSIYLFTPDYEKIAGKMEGLKDEKGEQICVPRFCYGFNLNISEREQVDFYKKLNKGLNKGKDYTMLDCESRAENRQSFYGLYGGIFFLGILLGIVFVAATALIMYYKQISEGFEDRMAFEIMQKVGMTKREIKQSVSSQVLTVFFAPLLMAGIHLAFSFPIISKMLLMFGLNNQKLFAVTMLGCFLLFGLLYTLFYIITSKTYYRLVSRRSVDG